ncbi:YwpF family protein [Bacillus sp. Marseille-P3661]|uniref:YwpF family protein n=1 Tax=Bacillus sp. Marseille-P3661 TaxID=1936234 RepID=UPI000C852CFB|nr:YwpF family protein [Bacillus sp. Marseille-P3661]
MKTFRLCSLTIYVKTDEKTTAHEIPLEDGLIINKEDQGDHWLLEGLLSKDYKEFFDVLKEKAEPLLVEAAITSKDNRPASFVATVRETKSIEDRIQLLLDATRIIRKENFSDIILKDLIDKGITGEDLMSEFKRMKKERGPAFQIMIDQEMKEIKARRIEK